MCWDAPSFRTRARPLHRAAAAACAGRCLLWWSRGRFAKGRRWVLRAEAPSAAWTASGDAADILGDGSVIKSIIEEGEDPPVYPVCGDECITHFIGTLPDGTVFNDTTKRDQPFKFALGAEQVLEGFDEGVATMRKGERALLKLTPEVAYGSLGARDERGWQVPPDTAVTFDVRLLDIKAGGYGREDIGPGGKGERYSWERKGAEVLVTVPVKVEVQAKDIAYAFQEKRIFLAVEGDTIFEGVPGCDVEAEESFWELGKEESGERCIFVHLQKKGSLSARWSPDFLLKGN
ncbi:unnamed protein product [Effrenium voratum]|nr:unnamed protein product [Effrenium voratum]